MSEVLESRRVQSAKKLEELRAALVAATELLGGKGCVYVTGSFARGEASVHSDLDLFIAGKTRGGHKRALSRLDEICVKAELIQANKVLRIPEFSGDGEYLMHYTTAELVKGLGHPQDDASNTFTARLLLLLESSPLLGEEVYREVVDEVIEAYWRDFTDHRADFVPAFFANDVLRLWRTFCVNYEARTSTESAEKKAKRKLKNYKLKHSRMLTCYSALLYLLAVYSQNQSVQPSDVRAMAQATPTQRLQWLKDQVPAVRSNVEDLLEQYVRFLDHTDADEPTMVGKFQDSGFSRRMTEDAGAFGDKVFTLLSAVGAGAGHRFFRLLVV